MSMRLFVALDIGEAVRTSLREAVRCLRPLCPGARWTRPEGQHVTLKFLGEVGEERLEGIRSLLAPIQSTQPVTMHFRGIGFFPGGRRPRVLWAGVEASPNLAELAKEVEGALSALGFACEERAFRPHLTLARFAEPGAVSLLPEKLGEFAGAEFGCVEASEFHLFRSHLKPGGAEYTRLETFPFVEKKV